MDTMQKYGIEKKHGYKLFLQMLLIMSGTGIEIMSFYMTRGIKAETLVHFSNTLMSIIFTFGRLPLIAQFTFLQEPILVASLAVVFLSRETREKNKEEVKEDKKVKE
jgi:hypothetical protein